MDLSYIMKCWIDERLKNDKMAIKLFRYKHGDLSKHRLHTTKYEDLCM